MQETMLQPPRTIMEVFKMLPKGTLAEVIENTLYMSPAPNGQHQRIVADLLFKIRQYTEPNDLGLILPAPHDVYLDETSNAVEPDLIFILKENMKIFNPDGDMHGVPDLLIEILSPGNQTHDKVRKKDLYEKVGVKEYWIVDPSTREAIGYKLIEQKYSVIGEYVGEIKSQLLNHSFTF